MNARRADVSEPEFLRCARAFEAECDYVHRALRRHGVRRQDAVDLVQEVFLVMWRRWADFDPSRELRPWLAGIAFKVAHAHHRRFWRREIPSEGIDPAGELPGPEDQLARARARSLALAALAQLPERHRSVLVMHDLDGVPVQDIAALVQAPRFTVHTRLRRARAAFERTVQALEAEPRASGRARTVALAPAALLALERQPIAAPSEVLARFRARLRHPPRVLDPGGRPVPPVGRPWLVVGALAVMGGLAVLVVPRTRPAPRPPRATVSAHPLPRWRAPIAVPPAPPVPEPTAAAPAGQAPAASVDAGLVGYWRFDDGGTSLVARDLSGRGRDCVLHGFDATKAWVSGRSGGAVRLRTRGWLECPQPATVGKGPVSITVAFWANRTQPHTASTLVDRYLGPGTETLFHFALRGNTLQLWSAVWSMTTVYELESPLVGWHHLAFTHGGRTTKIFIDGNLVAQRDDTHPKGAGLVTTAPLVVGAFVKDPTRVWQHFDGALDDLRLYDRALSDAEIETLATR